jgi:hypothetical protein
VAAVYDHGLVDEVPFLVFRFVPGQSLEQRLGSGLRLAPEEAAKILDGILRGLEAAHDVGVVHRDLKPANVLLDEDGAAVLTDFGLARLGDGSGLTRTGEIVGTPLYVAPEQLRGRDPAPAVDLYAAGLIHYRMLLGQLPFPGDDISQVILLKSKPLPPLVWDWQVPSLEGHRDLVRDLVAQDPGERPASAAVARARLEALVEDVGFQATSVGPRPASDPRRQRLPKDSRRQPARPGSPRAPTPEPSPRGPWRLLGGVGLVVVAILAGSALRTRSGAGGAAPGEVARPGAPPAYDEELTRVAQALEDTLREDAAVRDALALVGESEQPGQREVYQRGRRVLRDHVVASHLRDRLRRKELAQVSPEAYGALARISRIERLLLPDPPEADTPLYGPRESPGLTALLAAGVRFLADPRLESDEPVETWERERAFVAQLSTRPGQEWKPLRRFEDMAVFRRGERLYYPDGETPRAQAQVLVQTYDGMSFENPLENVNSAVQLTARDSWQVGLDDSVPGEVSLELADVGEGDLILGTWLTSWGGHRHAWLRIDGERESLEAVVTFPAPRRSTRGRTAVRVGGYLQVRAALLPEGARSMRWTAVGLQPFAESTHTVRVEEVHQLVAGPLPELLE